MRAKEYKVYEFRPDFKLSGNLLRYNNGNWIDDDGEYDLAFIQKTGPFASYIKMPSYLDIGWSWCKNMNWRANVLKHPNGNAWHRENEFRESWHNRDSHPNQIACRSAMDKCCEMNSCANGRGVDLFYINEKTIIEGLVREVETKEILTPPDKFNCIWCGELDWKSKQK